MHKVVELVNEWNRFDEQYPDSDLEGFCRYYLNQKAVTGEQRAVKRTESAGVLLRVLGRMLSAFNLYHRAAMQKTALPSPEGFYYLNALAYLGEARKTELIQYLFAEYTTGMEAINKLLGVGFIQERPDETDKRARLLSLTETGKQVLVECYQYSQKAGEMIFKDVSGEIIQLCLQLLSGVEAKHSRLIGELKNQDFDKMYSLVMED